MKLRGIFQKIISGFFGGGAASPRTSSEGPSTKKQAGGLAGFISGIFKRRKSAKTTARNTTSEADVITQNFKDLVNSMTKSAYAATRQGFTSNKRTDAGTRAKEQSAEKIQRIIDEAISARGAEAVAGSIQANGEYLQQLVEDLVFAIYNRKYATWGGGRSQYELRLAELKEILNGGFDNEE